MPDHDSSRRVPVPKIVWCLWFQGWDQAPEVVRACLQTWRRHNPGWSIRALCRDDLPSLLDRDEFRAVEGKHLEPEALSDVVRLALLRRYGGVWADSTLYCLRPLDEWLPQAARHGFFAFDRPGPDRMISSWFLAASMGSEIIRQWHDRTVEYWRDRHERDHYFWVHHLFGRCYEADPHFRSLWDRVPKHSADGPHRYLPYEETLHRQPTRQDRELLDSPTTPVLKLTHKISPPAPGEDSVLRRLCDRALAPDRPRRRIIPSLRGRSTATAHPRHTSAPRKRLLVTWYGSFEGHGTIGDLLAMQSVTTHLVGLGHRVDHASGAHVQVRGATGADWRQVDPDSFDAVIFVCGPILKTHPETAALFDRFAGRPLAGVSVSMFPQGHFNFIDPFDSVFAREGKPERFEDVALIAPRQGSPSPREHPRDGVTLGVVLRGPQGEYGDDRCLWNETEDVVNWVAQAILADRGGRVLAIENHLLRSGITPEAIEHQYRACDLILTSRFHGAMLAVRNGVPYIAIDQIRGGAKVDALLGDSGWPHRFRADRIDREEVLRAARRLLAGDDAQTLVEAREHAVLRANDTLVHLQEWIDHVGRPSDRPANGWRRDHPQPGPWSWKALLNLRSAALNRESRLG
ncbi:capsular polysaccharide synthesis protein [Tautonia sp. JC769]|uniref:capsular polysaccharide synthesis protein n=1 Tax=Tautonia sp. JC769 TaxID=3232135 RepID=UPI0034586248